MTAMLSTDHADLLIRGGRVVDGTGAPAFSADVAIRGDRLLAVGPRLALSAERIIDATGLVVSPGWIDIHCHSDIAAFTHPDCREKALQGVTTEINGNCGFSPAPAVEAYREPLEEQSYFLFGEWPRAWSSMDEYLTDVECRGVALNMAGFVGLNALRTAVMGMENRPPNEDEMAAIKRLLEESLDQGALGLSTGLIYEPGAFTTTDELVELASVLADHDGIYVSHIRGERETSVEATEELIAIGERSGAPVHMSHLECVDRPNWGTTELELEMMLAARDRGVDVTYDMYPWRGSPVRLFSMVPRWAVAGGIDAFRRRLHNRDERQRMKADAPAPVWSNILVTQYDGEDAADILGRDLASLAQERNQDAWDVAFDLFLTTSNLIITQLDMLSETDVRAAMKHPLGMIGSDGTFDPAGIRHPRLYSTFPEVLGRYVREERVLSMEEAVRKFTSAPAARLRMWDIGLLRPGMRADVTIFDAQTIGSRSTYTEPDQPPLGVAYVIVAGQVTVEGGRHLGARAGVVFRRGTQ